MALDNVKCPTCGGPMTSRANKSTGQRFWGCNAFPTCKGTRNTDGEAPRHWNAEAPDSDSLSPSERQRQNDRRRW